MRIRVDPESLRSLGSSFRGEVSRFQDIRDRLTGEMNALDWEAKAEAQVVGRWDQARTSSLYLGSNTSNLSVSLTNAASAFLTADSELSETVDEVFLAAMGGGAMAGVAPALAICEARKLETQWENDQPGGMTQQAEEAAEALRHTTGGIGLVATGLGAMAGQNYEVLVLGNGALTWKVGATTEGLSQAAGRVLISTACVGAALGAGMEMVGDWQKYEGDPSKMVISTVYNAAGGAAELMVDYYAGVAIVSAVVAVGVVGWPAVLVGGAAFAAYNWGLKPFIKDHLDDEFLEPLKEGVIETVDWAWEGIKDIGATGLNIGAKAFSVSMQLEVAKAKAFVKVADQAVEAIYSRVDTISSGLAAVGGLFGF